MQIRKLRNKLPHVDVRRDGRRITFHGAGLTYSIDGKDNSRSEEETAALIRSKIPSAVIVPPNA